jgi:hypothetical protein
MNQYYSLFVVVFFAVCWLVLVALIDTPKDR